MESIRFEGTLSELERELLQKRIERFGFSFSYDKETDLVVARRPEVIRKTEFVEANRGHESQSYCSEAWARLWHLYRHGSTGQLSPEHRLEKIPACFIPGSTSLSSEPLLADQLLVRDTLPPTVEWGKQNYVNVVGLSERAVTVWERVADELCI